MPQAHAQGDRFAPAERIQQNLTAALERKLLVWMAERMPSWVNSDHLTLVGFGGQILAGACYALARWNRYALLGGIAFIVLNWFGDSLDGTLARVRNQQRPRYGFYVDHLIDTYAAFFLMGGLALSGFIHPEVAAAMLIAFLMLSIEVYLASYTLREFRLSYWLFGPTELRIVLAIGNIALFLHPQAHLFGRSYLLFDVGGVIATFGMGVMLIVSSILHTRRLYREESFK
jgi:phosphatidylglycerophosphate synthase